MKLYSNTNWFRNHVSHSPEQIFAAGGTTAFGRKTNKTNSTLIKALEDATAADPFTNDEWDSLLSQLKKGK
jgi:hypothetical protein